jgi:hypothetical protein
MLLLSSLRTKAQFYAAVRGQDLFLEQSFGLLSLIDQETIMENREMLLNEIFETALQNDMTYFG